MTQPGKNVPFKSYASIFNTLLLFLTAVVRRDTGARKEKEGKIIWKSQLGTYTSPKLHQITPAFSLVFSSCVCTYCCKGLLPQLEHRWMLIPGQALVQANLTLHLPGGLPSSQIQLNLCRANLVISDLYNQAYKRHLRDSLQIQQNCVSAASLGWRQHCYFVMAWKRRHCEMWMSKISPDTA